MVLDFPGYVTRVNLEGQEGRRPTVTTSNGVRPGGLLPLRDLLSGFTSQRAGTVQEMTRQ